MGEVIHENSSDYDLIYVNAGSTFERRTPQ